MNPILLYDKKSNTEGFTKNWVAPDDSNTFYIDSNPTGASATMSSLDSRFTSFSRSDTNTLYTDMDNGNDTTGTGTWSNPYQTIQKALENVTDIKFQVGIKTSTNTEDTSTFSYEGKRVNFNITTLQCVRLA